MSVSARILIDTIQKYLRSEEPALASAALKTYLRNHPDSLELILVRLERLFTQWAQNPFWKEWMLEAYLILGEDESLLIELEDQLPQNPYSAHYFKMISQLIVRQPRHKSLIKLLSRLHQSKLLSKELTEILASMYLASDQADKAYKLYEDWLRQDPDNLLIKKMLVDLALLSKNYTEAKNWFLILLEQAQMSYADWVVLLQKRAQPQDPQYWVVYAETHIKLLKPHEALQAYQQIYSLSTHPSEKENLILKIKDFLKTYPDLPEAQMLLARMEMDLGFYSESVFRLNQLLKSLTQIEPALELYIEIIKKCPEQILARQSLIEIFVHRQEWSAALEHMHAMLNIDQDSSEWLLTKLKKMIDQMPDSFSAKLLRAKIYLAQSKFKLAYEEAQNLEKISSQNYELFQIQADVLCQQKKFLLAKQAYQKALMICPYDKTLHDQLRQTAFLELDFQIIEKQKNFVETSQEMLALGQLFFKRGSLDESISCYRFAARDPQTAFEAWQYLGLIHKEKGDLQAAQKAFLSALEAAVDPQNSEKIHFYLGLLHESMGEYGHALKYFDLLFPDHFSGLSLRKQHLQKKDATGLVLVESFPGRNASLQWASVRLSAETQKPDLEMAVRLIFRHEWNLAKIKIEKCLEDQPQDELAWNHLACLLFYGGNMDLAEEILKKHISRPSAVIHLSYAFLLMKKNKFEEAQIWVEKSLSEDDTLYTAQLNVGDLYYQLGDMEKALSYWERAFLFGNLPELAMRRLQFRK